MKNSHITLSVLLLTCLVWSSNLLGQDEVPGAPQAKPIVLTGGTIHTVSGAIYKSGEILFESGKITAVGRKVERPDQCQEISIEGKHVFPGMFEAHSQMGLTEISAVRATNDYAEAGTINPNVKAIVSVYPDNVVIPVTRANGVLFAVSAPESGMISGKSAVLQLDGWTYEDLALKSEATMQINWPSQYISPRRRSRMSEKEIKEAEKEQADNLIRIRDFFDEARRYRDARASENSSQKYDAKLDSMIAVVDGELPMMIRADRAADIQSAVAFAMEQGLKMILLGGYDADVCADLLKKHHVPVIVSAVYRTPQRRSDGYDKAYSLPARLKKAGVKYCISGTDRSETWNARTLPYHAGTAVGFGLSPLEALKAVTLYPAEILGVADRVGSLEVGKDASLFVCDGDPLETTTKVEMAFIQGRKVDLSNRHLRLYKKYEQRYKQLDSKR